MGPLVLVALLVFLFCVVPPYDRDLYPHWIDTDGDCQNVRHELLLERSIGEAVLSEDGCRAVSGYWIDAYTGEMHTLSRDIHVDHVVALQELHYAGAWAFSPDKKRELANWTGNLVLTSAVVNQTKSAHPPNEWYPERADRACWYAKKRLQVFDYWELRPTAKEAIEHLERCG